MSLQDAIDVLCEMYEQPIETMGPQIEGFIPELLSKGLLEPLRLSEQIKKAVGRTL